MLQPSEVGCGTHCNVDRLRWYVTSSSSFDLLQSPDQAVFSCCLVRTRLRCAHSLGYQRPHAFCSLGRGREVRACRSFQLHSLVCYQHILHYAHRISIMVSPVPQKYPLPEEVFMNNQGISKTDVTIPWCREPYDTSGKDSDTNYRVWFDIHHLICKYAYRFILYLLNLYLRRSKLSQFLVPISHWQEIQRSML